MGAASLGAAQKETYEAPDGGVNAVVLDAGALIALERRNRRISLFLEGLVAEECRILVPTTVMAQVLRDPSRQFEVWQILQAESTDIVPLDAAHARAAGALLAKSGTTDVVDAHVVVCAQAQSFPIVTSDPFDLRRLDPSLPLIVV
jgi:predicted nucleic acid-binding protein